jgi:RIO kinase 1
MRVPDALQPLLDQGVIEEVVRPLMSGKEAAVYLVVSEGELCVAKLYKDADHRSFKHRAAYTEGRRVRNSRSRRAMAKRSKFGREQVEAAWRTAEVDMIHRLQSAGVRVPEPYAFIEGVLVMELVADPHGNPAPRLTDVEFSSDEAWDLFHILLKEVQKMLCAGVVHGDLSDFNVLLAADGPVIIDFPQAIDAAHNRNARQMLVRDVYNLTRFLARYCGKLRKRRYQGYGTEMWTLYERGELTPETTLTGKKPKPTHTADAMSLLEEIEAIQAESRKRREALGLPPRRPARQPTQSKRSPRPLDEAREAPGDGGQRRKRKRKRRKTKPDEGTAAAPAPARKAKPASAPAADLDPLDDLDALLSVED